MQFRLVPANYLSQNFIMLIVGGKDKMQDAIWVEINPVGKIKNQMQNTPWLEGSVWNRAGGRDSEGWRGAQPEPERPGSTDDRGGDVYPGLGKFLFPFMVLVSSMIVDDLLSGVIQTPWTRLAGLWNQILKPEGEGATRCQDCRTEKVVVKFLNLKDSVRFWRCCSAELKHMGGWQKLGQVVPSNLSTDVKEKKQMLTEPKQKSHEAGH